MLSSEDGRGPYFPKDLDAISQDSKSGEVSLWAQGAAAKAAIHKGAMSEPVRRAHRVKIHEPPETRRGIFSRMSSIDSHHMAAAPCVTADLHDFDTSPQASCLVDNLVSGSQNPIQEELEVELDDSAAAIRGAEQETGKTCEPESPALLEGLAEEPKQNKEVASEVEPVPDTESHPQPRLPPHLQPLPASKLLPLIPPPSPARVRRTLEAPPSPLPSTPVRTKPRSHSCPRRPTTCAQTPVVKRKPAVHWEAQRVQTSGRYDGLVKQIPNGLCMPDSTSSSSDISSDSLELLPRRCTAEADQREGTLQREMKAMFDQRMRDIRCKSPLFFDDES